MIDALAPAVLASLLDRCAPRVGPVTMAAVIRRESAGRPYVLGDNTARRSYAFADPTSAERTARALLARGHSLDMGLTQVNSVHLGERGVSLAALFDPCTNVAIGSEILRADYLRAVRFYGAGQDALAHALSAYNTGNFVTGAGYAQAVMALARPLPLPRAALADGPIVVDLDRPQAHFVSAFTEGPIVVDDVPAAHSEGINQ